MHVNFNNIYRLGVKELRGLMRDYLMLALIVYSFTLGIYSAAKGYPDSLTNAAIAVVDEDCSQLSQHITDSFFPPMFMPVKNISIADIDTGMDLGKYTFVLVIPAEFEKDVIAGKNPELQLNVDATRMSQAFTGSGYIQEILLRSIKEYFGERAVNAPGAYSASLVLRNRYNQNLTASWFFGVAQLVNNITMLAIILTGAALIKERENGTLEHLLVMPVTPFEIMVSKIWSMLVVVLLASLGALIFIVHGLMKVPIAGSGVLFMTGVALHLFAVTSMGIFLGCVGKNMPQLGMLLILVLMPMQMLSGGSTPMESMPAWVRIIMQAAPTTHFVAFSQTILFRGGGLEMVWKQFAALLIIGVVLFCFSLERFRKSVA